MVSRRALIEIPSPDPVRYEVRIGAGSLAAETGRHAAERAAAAWAVVSDEAVAESHGAAVREALAHAGGLVIDLRVPSGESSKTRRCWERLQDEAIAAGVRRDGVIVAVGGGVVGDLAGFAAATLFRGVDLVQVPTTLLAMVDSAVGGKTGVDTPAGKNLVGAFHQPAHVIVDVAVLETLPDRHLRAGLAEVLKYGVILDEELFVDLEDGLLESCLARVPEALIRVVDRCVRLKSEVVAEDEREGGRRQILNFGHTVGHAVEAASGFETLHGEAVAIGMVVEARLAERLVGAEAGLGDRIADLCTRAGLPVAVPEALDSARLLELAGRDKKVRAGAIRCALPVEVGRMAGADDGWSVAVDGEVFRAILVD